jgi:lysozyme
VRISAKGLKLVKEFEGCLKPVGGGRFKPYICPAGVLTIGWGHTNAHGRKFDASDVWTQTECDEALLRDMAGFEKAVQRLVKVSVNQNQFDALVSFAYNCGDGALAKSTLLRKLNAGDYAGAAAQFAAWNKGGGRVLPGLTRRRAAEAALFRAPDISPKSAPEPLPPPPDIESSEPMPQQIDPPAEDRPSIFEKISTWFGGLSGLSFLAYLTDWRVVLALGVLVFAGAAAAIWFMGPQNVRQWIRRKVNR